MKQSTSHPLRCLQWLLRTGAEVRGVMVFLSALMTLLGEFSSVSSAAGFAYTTHAQSVSDVPSTYYDGDSAHLIVDEQYRIPLLDSTKFTVTNVTFGLSGYLGGISWYAEGCPDLPITMYVGVGTTNSPT